MGVAYWDNYIIWSENDGNESFTEHTIDSDFLCNASVCTTDIDGDCEADVLGALSKGNEINWWEHSDIVDMINTVIENIEELSLGEGVENCLISKLNNVIKAIRKGPSNAVVNTLNAFNNYVRRKRGMI